MKILFPLAIFVLASCSSAIKGETKEKEVPLSDTTNIVKEYVPEFTENLVIDERIDLIGYWVGWFKSAIPDDEFVWGEMSHRNKINVSIDSFVNDSVFGHSVIANNYTTFKGTVELDEFDIYHFECSEPGNGAHDGKFTFKVGKKDSIIKGEWEAFGDIPVYKRSYSLEKRLFEYNALDSLNYPYFDENKVVVPDEYTEDSILAHFGSVRNAAFDFLGVEDTMDWDEAKELKYKNIIIEEMNMYSEEYYSTSPMLFEMNPSVDTMTVSFVENLSKADIFVLRNSIYARHGYSFKDKLLRRYFDSQEWYMPVIADIRSELTDLEKANIQLLLAYEEHAEEYYDYYGR